MRAESRGLDRCRSKPATYETFEFSESAMFHVNEGQSRLLPGFEPCHFFSLFGTPGVISTVANSVGKPFHVKQFGLEIWSCRASKTPCGTSAPKFSHRFPLIIHYLRAKSPSSNEPVREGVMVI